MTTHTQTVAAAIRSAIEEVDDGSLQTGMARAAAEYLAQAWDSYDDSVPPEAVASDLAACIDCLQDIARRVATALPCR